MRLHPISGCAALTLILAQIGNTFVLAEPLTTQSTTSPNPIPLVSAATGDTFSVTPLNTVDLGVTLSGNLNATDNPANIPVTGGNTTSLFSAGNVVKIDSEYLLITGVAQSSLTASRAQLGSVAASHSTNASVLRVYQVDVNIASPNVFIGAYQLNLNYDSSRLSIVTVNVFPGLGPLGTPVAVNTNNPGVVTVNSFNAGNSFKGAATPVARLYFTGTASGSTNISAALTNVADTAGNDLNLVSSGVTTAVGTPSLTVTALNIVVKKVRGQITSQ